jgi:hypothetical protein
MRVADDGAPGAANSLAATPLPSLANTEQNFKIFLAIFFKVSLPGIALLGDGFAIAEQFSSVLTGALLLLDASAIVADSAFGTVAALDAKFGRLVRIWRREASCLGGWTACFVNRAPSAVHAYYGKCLFQYAQKTIF